MFVGFGGVLIFAFAGILPTSFSVVAQGQGGGGVGGGGGVSLLPNTRASECPVTLIPPSSLLPEYPKA